MSDNKNKPGEETPSQRFEEDFPVVNDDHLLAPDDRTELHDQIDVLNKTLKETQAKADENWERLVRKEAELQNAIRRAEQEVDNARKFAVERFAGEMLQVLDSLDQGLAYSQTENITVDHLVEGIKLTHSVFMNAMDKHGIKPIDPAVGEVFNPAFHEAISIQPSADLEPNRILAVVQKGYMLQNRLLRPARVVVTSKQEQ
ncbi:nucleotide exchange factor GrpE [Candidatus Berkiella aquae]|uniref:Protein GrpE n=1 Tax=Candidatus Berkiella aquae TaxID=295108 RepID=A0A0Q9YPK2_9GAMM|nr:nucleotide exchange factor GrpE [Candidatus Berkiella aquae]MCS5710460.1 nucleotide exchange factor GrpE [Candidatus Berkiella aquae]